MESNFGTLPVFIKISAISLGTPLVILGIVIFMSDIAKLLQAHSFFAGPHSGLALGPVFALVGLSMLWPLGHQH